MNHKAFVSTAALLLIASLATACTKKEPATNTALDVAVDTNAAVNATMPTSGPVSVAVPEMKPTGDMAKAVKPGDPAVHSNGSAPQMKPTGDSRAPFTPAKQ